MDELKQEIMGENGIRYRLTGDYYIPMLEVQPRRDRPIGVFGRMHGEYLKQEHPIRYEGYVLHERLWDYLAEVDAQANARMDVIMEYILQKEGVTEDLKARDQMEWVRRMNNIRSRAEEIVLRELIFV